MSPTLSPPDATPPPARPSSWRRWFRRLAGMILILLLGPIAMLAFGGLDLETHWSQASRASTGQAPDPGVRCPCPQLARGLWHSHLDRHQAA